MRLLREYIRTLLTEAALGVGDLDKKVVVIHDRGNIFDVTLHAKKIKGADVLAYYSEGSLGTIEAQKNFPRPGCGGAYKVRWAEAPKGWGPLLYDVAMEYATMNGGGLTPDRTTVSPDAAGVWDYYLANRGDVEPHQLDDDEGLLTPEDKSDDCSMDAVYRRTKVFSIMDDMEESGDYTDEEIDNYWKDDLIKSALSKRYVSNGTPTINALRAAGKLLEL